MNAKLQSEILAKYLGLYKRPTIRVLGSEAGIQSTRFFRLLNGSMMRLDEYEKIQATIEKKRGFSLSRLLEECEGKLSERALKEIEELLHKKLQLWEISKKVRKTEELKAA